MRLKAYRRIVYFSIALHNTYKSNNNGDTERNVVDDLLAHLLPIWEGLGFKSCP
jgi:hypothetical protein